MDTRTILILVILWSCVLPLIPASGRHFSLALIVNQVEWILSHPHPSRAHRPYVKGLILSDKDEYLDNPLIHAFYAQRPILYVRNVAHARTIDAADKYREAAERLLKILAP